MFKRNNTCKVLITAPGPYKVLKNHSLISTVIGSCLGSEIWGEDQQQRRETSREHRPQRAAKTWAAPYPPGVGDPLATSQPRPQPSPPEEGAGDEGDGKS